MYMKNRTTPKNSIAEPMLTDGAVTVNKLANGAVTGPKLGAGVVGTGNIADGAVTGAKIPDGSLTTNDVARFSDYFIGKISIGNHANQLFAELIGDHRN